jgi:hypothetical protein
MKKAQVADLGLLARADDGNRTRAISLGIYCAESVHTHSDLRRQVPSRVSRRAFRIRL